jgi:two-component system chemotaxis response regulator CheY
LIVTGADKLVLVVDDEPTIRNVISDVLQERGFRVLTAANGSDALVHLGSARPDVMILDLLMPVMHGWAFMESYLEKTGGEPIPIVVVSVNPALPRSYNRFGVHKVVSKPFKMDLLLQAVEQACSSGQSEAA